MYILFSGKNDKGYVNFNTNVFVEKEVVVELGKGISHVGSNIGLVLLYHPNQQQ